MKNSKNILYIVLLALCMIGFAACSDDEEVYDFPGDPYNRVYMEDKSTSYTIVQTPVSSIGNLEFEITLKCTQPASENIRVTVDIDNSLIEAYNEEYETNYEAIPIAALVIENETTNILPGAMIAVDTVHITLTEDQSIVSTLKNKDGYLIPLCISTVEGETAQISTNFFTNYLTVEVDLTNINSSAAESDITGTLVTDQSGWTIKTNNTSIVSTNPIESIFNGNAADLCNINNNIEDITIEINMGKPYTFDGIRFYYEEGSWWTYTYGSFTSGMTIETSMDGATWNLEHGGTLTQTSEFCVFYTPVTSQYIRLVKPKGISDSVSLTAGIFNVYAN